MKIQYSTVNESTNEIDCVLQHKKNLNKPFFSLFFQNVFVTLQRVQCTQNKKRTGKDEIVQTNHCWQPYEFKSTPRVACDSHQKNAKRKTSKSSMTFKQKKRGLNRAIDVLLMSSNKTARTRFAIVHVHSTQ